MPDIVNKKLKAKVLARTAFMVLLAVFFLSRAIYLDSDLPYKVLGSYVPIDEFYYTIPAFNLYHYGEINHNVVPFIQENNNPQNIMHNIVTYYSLSFWGNNFYGLRMGSVLAASLVFIIFFFMLKRILKAQWESGEGDLENRSNKTKKLIIYVAMAYLLLDFSFLIAGKVAEPTIYRMLALVLMMYVGSLSLPATKLESKWYYSMFLGFLSMATVLYVYIYNIFIFAAFALTIFIWAYKSGLKNAIKQCLWFLLGSILCLLTYQIYIDVAYGSNLMEVFRNLVPFQSRMGLGINKMAQAKTYLGNLTMLFMTNIFRFNLILLFIFLVSIPVFLKKVGKEKSNFDILIINLLGFLTLQSVFVNDYALRKLLVILPLVLIVIIGAYQYADRYFLDMLKMPRGKIIIGIYWLMVWILTLQVFNIYLGTQIAGDSVFASGYFKYLNLAVFLFFSLMMVRKYLFSVCTNRMAIIAAMLLVLLPNLYLDCRYVFLNRTYSYRDAMIAMKERVDGKIIVGGCNYGFRLYNNSIPVLNLYSTIYGAGNEETTIYNKNFDRLFSEKIGSYSISYSEDLNDTVIGVTYMREHNLYLVEEYEFNNCASSNIGLFAPENE